MSEECRDDAEFQKTLLLSTNGLDTWQVFLSHHLVALLIPVDLIEKLLMYNRELDIRLLMDLLLIHSSGKEWESLIALSSTPKIKRIPF